METIENLLNNGSFTIARQQLNLLPERDFIGVRLHEQIAWARLNDPFLYGYLVMLSKYFYPELPIEPVQYECKKKRVWGLKRKMRL